MMDPQGLERDLSAGTLRPVYLFHGRETLLRERYLNKIAASVPEGFEDFNLHRLSAGESSPGEVLAQARTMPFMGRSVIIVRGVEQYPAEALSPFLDYLDSPNEAACLVLVADKPDFRQKFYKAFRDRGLDVVFEAPRGRGLIPWVKEAMSGRGHQLDEEGARRLIDQVGTDLMELDQELEKVSLYALGQERVGVQEVKAAARLGPTASVFELGDAIGEQDRGRALSALKDLLQTGHHLPVLAMVVRHFRLLLKARLLLDRRRPRAEAAKVLGLSPFIAGKYLDQASGLGLAEIKKGLARLLAADLALKSSPLQERLVMERLVLDLASLRPVRRPGT